MDTPSYFLSRPQYEITADKQSAFEALYLSISPGSFIDYRLPYPKWEFLTYLCEAKELVLHGSQNEKIGTVKPHQANDKRAYSNQRGIYATTDGIWVIYFAILDRKKYPEMSLFNSCWRARISAHQLTDPHYFFSITHSFLGKNPFCDGVIYILPRQSFGQEAPQQLQGMEIIFPHWIGKEPTKPAAKLKVGPADFPYMTQIHGHNDNKLEELYRSNPDVFPIEAVES
jgi:hypothetical protein